MNHKHASYIHHLCETDWALVLKETYITGWQGPEKCEHEPTTTYCADEILIYLSNMFNMFKMSLVYVLCRWHPQHMYIPLHADITSQGALCRPHNTQLQFDRILCHLLFGITQSYTDGFSERIPPAST